MAGLKWKLAQSLEIRWWKQYLGKKDVAGYLQQKMSYWDRFLKQIKPEIPVPAKLKILDAGCGPAGIFMALEGNTVVAIDPLLDKYRSLDHFRPLQYHWTSFRNEMMEKLDEENQYDLIFSINAINHVNDIDLCYNNLVKALKPGGFLVISTDAHRYKILKKIFQLFPGDALHPVQLSIDEYDSFLTRRGLTIGKRIRFKREAIFDYYITIAKKPYQ